MLYKVSMSVIVANRCTRWSCQITVGTCYLYLGASLDIIQLTMVILHLDEAGKHHPADSSGRAVGTMQEVWKSV